MELITAINERQSCRDFLNEEIEKKDIEKIIRAGIMAPSPLNSQPWNFMVINNSDLKQEICDGVEACKSEIADKSGWKWLEKYSVEFLRTTPVIIVVTGDKTKSGADTFQETGPLAFQHACAAAVQNMLLVAHSLGLGSLWFTLFDKEKVKEQLEIEGDKMPLAFVCVGKPAGEAPKAPRKPIEKKTVYID